MLTRLDKRANERVSGPAWDKIRPQLTAIHEAMVSVSPTVSGELTTIYIKYLDHEAASNPFAVVWVKKASEIVVGLALPLESTPSVLSGPPEGCKYAGLTGYFKVTATDKVPSGLTRWAAIAYDHTMGKTNA